MSVFPHEFSDYLTTISDNVLIKLINCYLSSEPIPEFCLKAIQHYTLKYNREYNDFKIVNGVFRQELIHEFLRRYENILTAIE